MKSLICYILCFASLVYADDQVPFELPASSEVRKLQSAVIKTEHGDLRIRLFPDDAPYHVANFKYLADKKFYQGSSFHLHEPGYILQGGDPTGSGHGGPAYSLPPEFSVHAHRKGSLGMARLSNMANPERRSHGSQFHILLRSAPHMDGKYTVFGQVVDGWEVLEKLEKGDVIRDVVVYVRVK